MVNDRNEFNVISNSEIEKILRITSAAKQAAMEEKPKSDATSLDETERSIISYCQRQVQLANDVVYNQFAVFKKLMTKATMAVSKIENLKFIHETFKDKYQYDIGKSVQEANIIKNELDLAKKDLYSFKQDNKIVRQEQSSTKPLLNWAIVFAIVFSESILNASFFAKGSELGLLGGIIQAFVIVMINVLVANLVVLIIRRRNIITISSIEKVGYTILSAILVGTLACFHFLVGHYRDALRIDFDNAYAFSVLNFTANPFVLIDFESYILVLMGFLFFIVLVIDLYKLKDPYPGYAEIQHKYDKIKTQYEDLNFMLLDEENEISTQINKKIDLMKEEVHAVYEEIQGLQIAKQQLENKYLEHIAYIKSLAISTVESYRSMNTDMRTTPKPKYFGTPIEFNYTAVEFIYMDDREKIVSLETAINHLPALELEAKRNIEKIKKDLKASSYGEIA
ncbi:hypothetical protein MNB_ARC-1_659 [hydrothermal vent metagenome]|uniref:Transmembrane protein n=1 Tax=hydrothermal vent metagenome TaxID=652676 RepID=A0A3B1E153_9ZZZZ